MDYKATMSHWLTRFVMEVRTQTGAQYTGKSMYQILCGLLRHLRDNGIHDKNFLDEKDCEFAEFYKLVDSKMKDLLQKGVCTETLRADPFTKDDDYQLWEKGIFGMKNAHTLQYTVFFYSCKLFGLRGRDEHRDIQCDQFIIAEDAKGRYVRFVGRNNKAYTGGLGQLSLTNKDIKHYCSEGPRCLATHYQTYLDVLGNEGPFYRSAIGSDGRGNIRYSLQPVGVAKLGGLTGNYANHSGKRSCATALYDAGIDEQDIMDRTGHRSTNVVRKYKRATDSTRMRVSNVLVPASEVETKMASVVSDDVKSDIALNENEKCSVVKERASFLTDITNKRSDGDISFDDCTFNF